MGRSREPQVSALIVGIHRDGSDCPATGEDAHRHSPAGRPLDRECATHGGRDRFEVRCDCGHVIPASLKLHAIEQKFVHLALHRGALTVTRVVNDGEGPTVITQTLTLAS